MPDNAVINSNGNVESDRSLSAYLQVIKKSYGLRKGGHIGMA